jgi:membrane associated rhomboid family serine protease
MIEERDYMRSPSLRWRPAFSVTVILVVANVLIFFLGEVYRNSDPDGFQKFFGYFALSQAGLFHGYLWQLMTFQFLHAGSGHLLFNMVTLYSLGRSLENFIGKKRFLLLYLASGMVGGLAQAFLGIILPSTFGSSVVGASAGLFGIVAALAVLMPDLSFLLFYFIPIKGRILLWLSFAISLALIFIPTDLKVAHAAHLGGLLAGVAWIKLGWHHDYAPLPWEGFFSRWRRRWRPLESRQRKRELVRAAVVQGRPWRTTPAETDVELPPEEFISKEVDPILDKISAHGLQSLTERERNILEAARKKMAKR